MAFIIRSDQELSLLDRSAKVIKAQDFWAYKQAREAVAEGIQRHDQIVDAAHSAFETEQRRGYLEGKETARLEQTGNMIGIISQTVNYFAKVEAQMVDLVLDAVRRIIDDFDDRERIVKVVRNSLASVRGQKQLLVKVNPLHTATIKTHISALMEAYPSIEQIEVIPDNQLAEDACVIESDIGQVEASMSGQLEALRASFARVFGNASADTHSEAFNNDDTSNHLNAGTLAETRLPI
jgi:type III secretion protein L